jgi:hypothetical protein
MNTTDFGEKSHHKALKSLGVLNNKHIPEVYLKKYKRYSQVLAGLIDTDGYLDNSEYDFCFANKTLSKIFHFPDHWVSSAETSSQS